MRTQHGMPAPGFPCLHLDGDQVEPEVADLGEESMQLRLVGHRPGKGRRSVVLASESEAVEPVCPAVVELGCDPERVGRWSS